jgi:hypothetical protein
MVQTASRARQETGKRERNYKLAQRQAQYREIQECTQWSQQWCSTAAVQRIKPLWHKSTRPKSNPTLPAKRCVLTCYHGTTSLSSEVRTMACFTLLATGKDINSPVKECCEVTHCDCQTWLSFHITHGVIRQDSIFMHCMPILPLCSHTTSCYVKCFQTLPHNVHPFLQ